MLTCRRVVAPEELQQGVKDRYDSTAPQALDPYLSRIANNRTLESASADTCYRYASSEELYGGFGNASTMTIHGVVAFR